MEPDGHTRSNVPDVEHDLIMAYVVAEIQSGPTGRVWQMVYGLARFLCLGLVIASCPRPEWRR